jgi:MOSC domain-containing protein YiiM
MNFPRIVSIQVGAVETRGTPGAAEVMGQPWTTAIFKYPVQGPVWLGESKLQGDGQADRRYHGGLDKAVLAYSADHYPIWREELPLPEMPYGGFGENLTIEALDETSVCIGDSYRIGDVVVQVSQPRQPCWKLGRRWKLKDLPARVKKRGWAGWYFRVREEGYLEAGMKVELIERLHPEWTVLRAFQAMENRKKDPASAELLASIPLLSVDFKEELISGV